MKMNDLTYSKVQAGSIILAVAVFLALLFVGIGTPMCVEMMDAMGNEAEFGWPSKAFPYIHWIWTVPCGLASAVLLVKKDRILSKGKCSAVDFGALALLMLLGCLWWYGTTVTRMIQIVD